MRLGLSFCLAAIIAVVNSSFAWAEDAKPGAQQAEHLDRPVRAKLDSLPYLPEKYDESESWPLMQAVGHAWTCSCTQ